MAETIGEVLTDRDLMLTGALSLLPGDVLDDLDFRDPPSFTSYKMWERFSRLAVELAGVRGHDLPFDSDEVLDAHSQLADHDESPDTPDSDDGLRPSSLLLTAALSHISPDLFDDVDSKRPETFGRLELWRQYGRAVLELARAKQVVGLPYELEHVAVQLAEEDVGSTSAEGVQAIEIEGPRDSNPIAAEPTDEDGGRYEPESLAEAQVEKEEDNEDEEQDEEEADDGLQGVEKEVDKLLLSGRLDGLRAGLNEDDEAVKLTQTNRLRIIEKLGIRRLDDAFALLHPMQQRAVLSWMLSDEHNATYRTMGATARQIMSDMLGVNDSGIAHTNESISEDYGITMNTVGTYYMYTRPNQLAESLHGKEEQLIAVMLDAIEMDLTTAFENEPKVIVATVDEAPAVETPGPSASQNGQRTVAAPPDKRGTRNIDEARVDLIEPLPADWSRFEDPRTACHDLLPRERHIFTSRKQNDRSEARGVCSSCDLLPACGEWAEVYALDTGIYGARLIYSQTVRGRN